MKLIIGGIFSGKYERLRALGFVSEQIADGETVPVEEAFSKPALNHLHALIRRLLQEGRNPVEFVREKLAEHPNIVIVCDEVGCGVVPIDKFNREYREAVGRICCEIAENADTVEKIYCGLVTVLKGGK